MHIDNRHIVLILLLFPLLVGLNGCVSQPDQPGDKILAKVGNSSLTIEQARKQIPEFIYKEDSVSALQKYKRDWIRRQLMVQEARRLKLDQKPEIRQKVERMKQDLYAQALHDFVNSRFDQKLNITREEAQNYYEANKDQFVLNEKYIRFRHMVAPDLASAQHAKSDLMRGYSWEAVVDKYAVNKESSLENSKQFWPISMALNDIPIMHRYLKVIGITEISPIQKASGHYHFVQLMEERGKGSHPDLDWLLGQIEDWLRLEKRRRHFSNYVKNLYLKAEANNEIQTNNVFGTTANTKSANDSLSTSLHD